MSVVKFSTSLISTKLTLWSISSLSKIDDKTVFDVTDYGREKYYQQQGFYNEVTKNEPDICD